MIQLVVWDLIDKKRGRQGSKRARMVVNKTSSTLPWTEIESDEDFDSLRFNFTGEAQGPSQTLPPDATPLDVLLKFFDDDMISLLVEETNRYSALKFGDLSSSETLFLLKKYKKGLLNIF